MPLSTYQQYCDVDFIYIYIYIYIYCRADRYYTAFILIVSIRKRIILLLIVRLTSNRFQQWLCFYISKDRQYIIYKKTFNFISLFPKLFQSTNYKD